MSTAVDTSKLSAKEKAALLKQLQSDPEATEPRKVTPLDLSEATEVGPFVVDLTDNDRVPDKTYVGQTLWFKGVNGAKGPEGGVYLYGRVVVGVKAAARKGILKIGSKHLEALQRGDTARAWVRFDGDRHNTLVGVMANYRLPKPRKKKQAA